MNDDLLQFFNYQVRDEIAKRYLMDRRILDEEKNEFNERLAEHQRQEKIMREMTEELEDALLTPENVRLFYQALGFETPPPFSQGLQDGEIRHRACFHEPWGLTRKARYTDLIEGLYRCMYKARMKREKSASQLRDLAAEINADIKRFADNYDVLSIVSLLKELGQDAGAASRVNLTGQNFTGDEVSSLAHTMNFKRINTAKRGLEPWPELPRPRLAQKKIKKLTKMIYKQNRGPIKELLSKKIGGNNG